MTGSCGFCFITKPESKAPPEYASDKAKKTGGIYIIHPNEIAEKLKDVELEEVCGIGKQAAKQFYRKGITSIPELLAKTPNWCRQAFGINSGLLICR